MRVPAIRDQDLATLRRTFARFPFVGEVLLFGSRATGHARRASDIDLAISAPGATVAEWLELVDAVESAPIIYEFDLVRLERTRNPRLLENIRRDGIPIYPESPRDMEPREFPGQFS